MANKYIISARMATNITSYRNLCILYNMEEMIEKINNVFEGQGQIVDEETYEFLLECSLTYEEHRNYGNRRFG